MPDTPTLTVSLGEEQPIRCPQCKSDASLHFDEVTLIDPGGDVVPLHAAGAEGLSVVTAAIGDGTRPRGRHLIVLPHWCASCGKRGELVLRQSSGQTLGQYREVQPA